MPSVDELTAGAPNLVELALSRVMASQVAAPEASQHTQSIDEHGRLPSSHDKVQNIPPIGIPQDSIQPNSIPKIEILHSSISPEDILHDSTIVTKVQRPLELIKFDARNGTNFIRLFHAVRRLKREMTPAEYLVLEELYALSFGYHQNYTKEHIGYNQLARATGLSRNGVIKAISGLNSRGRIFELQRSMKGRKWLINVPLDGILSLRSIPLEGIPLRDVGILLSDIEMELSSTPVSNTVVHNKKEKEKEKKRGKRSAKDIDTAAAYQQWIDNEQRIDEEIEKIGPEAFEARVEAKKIEFLSGEHATTYKRMPPTALHETARQAVRTEIARQLNITTVSFSR
jgi:hypothetical protein